MIDPRIEHENTNERTLLAWLRTAGALLGFGCALARFGIYLEHQPHGRGVSTTYLAGLVVLASAIVAVVLSLDDYHRRSAAIERGDLEGMRSRALYPFAILMGVMGLGLVILLFYAR